MAVIVSVLTLLALIACSHSQFCESKSYLYLLPNMMALAGACDVPYNCLEDYHQPSSFNDYYYR